MDNKKLYKLYKLYKNQYSQDGGMFEIHFTLLDYIYTTQSVTLDQADIIQAIIDKVAKINKDDPESIRRKINIKRAPPDLILFNVKMRSDIPMPDIKMNKHEYIFDDQNDVVPHDSTDIYFTFLGRIYRAQLEPSRHLNIDQAIKEKLQQIIHGNIGEILHMFDIQNAMPNLILYIITINPDIANFNSIPIELRPLIRQHLDIKDRFNVNYIDRPNLHLYKHRFNIDRQYIERLIVIKRYIDDNIYKLYLNPTPDKDFPFANITPDEARDTIINYDTIIKYSENIMHITLYHSVHNFYNMFLLIGIKYNKMNIVNALLDLANDRPDIKLFVTQQVILRAICSDKCDILNKLKNLLGTYEQCSLNTLQTEAIPLMRVPRDYFVLGSHINDAQLRYMTHGHRECMIWFINNYMDIMDKIFQTYDGDIDAIMQNNLLLLQHALNVEADVNLIDEFNKILRPYMK